MLVSIFQLVLTTYLVFLYIAYIKNDHGFKRRFLIIFFSKVCYEYRIKCFVKSFLPSSR